MQESETFAAPGGVRSPLLSVVITSHDRPEGVRRAVSSILDQIDHDDVQIVVVDDGSGPAAAAEIDLLGFGPVVVEHQADLGLGVARRAGAAIATGRWLTFLDDDDRWMPSWSDLILPQLVDGVGVVSGGARFTDPEGRHLGDDMPRRLGPLFSDLTAQYLAGCFAVRRDVYSLAGGYLPGLSCSHQTELFIRLGRVCAEMGLRSTCVDQVVADIERRPPRKRSLSNPRLLLDGARWMLARHADAFLEDPDFRADTLAIVAVNAVRSGRTDLARRAAVSSWWSRPVDVRSAARVAAMSVPALARMVWRNDTGFVPPSPPLRDPLGHVATLHERSEGVERTEPDLFFLPWRYRQNDQASTDETDAYWTGEHSDGDGRAQVPVYRLVGRLVRGTPSASVADVGCGTGDKLIRHVAPHAASVIGLDQGSGLDQARRRFPSQRWVEVDLGSDTGWDGVNDVAVDVVVCADVIEHVDDPYLLLRRLHGLVAADGTVILSTPDRSRLERGDPSGPPYNPRHVREWSDEELQLLVEAAGFSVLRRRHLLPRSYSATRTELNRAGYRALHRMAVPDRRSCLVFELRAK